MIPRSIRRVDVLLIELRGTESENLAYRLKAAFTRARAANDKTTLVLAASDSTLQSLRDDLAAYVDAFVILGQSDAADRNDNSRRWIAGQGRAPLTRSNGGGSAQAGERRNTTRLWVLPADGEQARRLLENLAALQAWLPSGLVGVTDRRLSCGSTRLRDVSRSADARPGRRLHEGVRSDAPIDADVQQASIDRLDLPG